MGCAASPAQNPARNPVSSPTPSPAPSRPAPGSPGTPSTSAAPPPAVVESIHVALGIPVDADSSDDVLLDRTELVISYNPRLNAANWVAWHLDATDLGSAKRTSNFHVDTELPRGIYPVRDDDYVRSGYDRGHLCPSADRTRSPDSNRATFVLSNVHPQWHELNAGPWEKLEQHERELAKQGKELFLVAGGIFDARPERIGKNTDDARRVAIPRASYKIVVVLEHGQRAHDVTPDTPVIAVVMPNQKDLAGRNYSDFQVPIRQLERDTGYDFDTRVSRAVQDAFESKAP